MNNIVDYQKNLLERAQSQVPGFEMRWNEEHGVACLLEGKLLPWDQIQEPERIIRAVLDEYGLLVGPPDVIDNYQETGVRFDKKGGAYRARAYQVFDNLPIYGATLLAFANEEQGVYRIQSSFWREVNVTAGLNFDEGELQRILNGRLRQDSEADAFEDTWRQQKPDDWALEHYPLTTSPTLYLYLVNDGFHPVYNAFAYQPMEWQGVDGQTRSEIGPVQMMLDAATGEVIWWESTKEGMAYTNQTCDGRSTLQDSNGTYLTRSLHVVQKDNTDYFMLNRLQTPEIRTYDANGTETGIENKLKADTDLSKDADGHWNTTTTSSTANTRRDAQQPEVDGHFYAEQAWNFYHVLGWDGFDNGVYDAWSAQNQPKWHCPVPVVAHIGMAPNAHFTFYTDTYSPQAGTNYTKYLGYIAFYEGECDGTTVKFDFMAGDPIIFKHEYQHAITYFGAAKPTGGPGFLYWNMWSGAIREGYSDALACLQHGQWINPLFFPEGAIHRPASGNGSYQITLPSGSTLTVYPRPFRRIEYPRSANTYDGSAYCDHYDDSDSTKDKYFHSTLLSHLAFLVGQGGVHQRASRGDAEFIPVKGVGLQRTAEIFHFALTQYFDTLPTNLAGETLIETAHLLLDAAKNVPNSSDRKCEYVMMRRALYALGLYPYDSSHNKTTYGGEACMLPWTYSWRFSQPYIGFPALWWQSPDLFINDNGSVEYNAIVGQENKVFARVRNIGDQALQNVQVKFYFSPMGTNLPASIAGWHTCKNQAGNDCLLDIPTLAANSMNFTNATNPPANQAVLWYLDPAYVTPAVDHFCLRAVISCEAANHNHDCPNDVQSNISYEKLPEGAAAEFAFQVANWLEEPQALDLQITHTLPRGYQVVKVGSRRQKKIVLRRGEPQTVRFRLDQPARTPTTIQPPFNGQVTGKLVGDISGRFRGELSNARREYESLFKMSLKRNITLSGLLAGSLETDDGKAAFSGDFSGELDPTTGVVRGTARGSIATSNGRTIPDLDLQLEGCLEPLRAVHFTQLVDGEAVGGVTLHVRLPRLRRQCVEKE